MAVGLFKVLVCLGENRSRPEGFCPRYPEVGFPSGGASIENTRANASRIGSALWVWTGQD
jgi:hypothetical protein